MFFRSIRKRLYLILALLTAIISIMVVNYLAQKKVKKCEQTHSRILKLENKWAHIIAQEARFLAGETGPGDLPERLEQVDSSCIECHTRKVRLIQKRIQLVKKIAVNKDNTVRITRDVSTLLDELTDSVDYIHEHHIATLKNLLKRNKVREESDFNGKSFRRSSTRSAPELDIIRQAVAIQHCLTGLAGVFYSLNTASSPLDLHDEFRRNINGFYRAVNTFEDFSLDAQDGLLAEELLESGRTFESLFTSLIKLKKEQADLHAALQDNHKEMDAAVSRAKKIIYIRRDQLKKQISLLERGSFFLIALLVFLIVRKTREIMRSLSGIVAETEKIQRDLSYRITENPAVDIEFLGVFRALNRMTEYIDRQTRKLHEEIQARTRVQRELVAEKERLAVTLRSITDGVITTDLQGNITLMNRTAEKLTGWSQKEARGRPLSRIFNIINKKTGKPCGSPVRKVLAAGHAVDISNHAILIAKDGIRRNIAHSAAPILDPDDNIIGVVLVFRDITAELKMEEEALRAEKLKSIGVLAGGIAHDFNNILAAILGNISLSTYLLNPDSKPYHLLQAAEKACIRAKGLAQQLLTFAKGGEPVRQTASIAEVIMDSADFVLRGSKAACHYDIPPDLWPVDIDTGQISQVIQNLILNACDAMPEGGDIYITCSNIDNIAKESFLDLPRARYVKITIRDTGAGIPGDIIDKIFDPYFTTKDKGSGLGLAISHSIIDKHNGHISVQSTPGKGTTFTIYLPAAAGQHKETKPGGNGLAGGSGRILVMDDEEAVLDVARQMLTHLGYDVILVKDGTEAVKHYRELHGTEKAVDAVIMDVTIPGGMGAREAVAEILAIDPEAKVIVSSGYSTDPIMAHFREYGFCAALAKPFDLSELGRTLGSILA